MITKPQVYVTTNIPWCKFYQDNIHMPHLLSKNSSDIIDIGI